MATLADRVTEAFMAANTGNPQAETLMLALLDEIATAVETPSPVVGLSDAIEQIVRLAFGMPRQSYVPGLTRLFEDIPHPNLLNALAACRRAGSVDCCIPDSAVVSSLSEPLNMAFYAARASISEIIEAMAMIEHRGARIAAVDMCHRRGEAEVNSAVDAIVNADDPRLRIAAAEVLGRDKSFRFTGDEADPGAMALLTRLLSDQEPDVTCAALRSIAAQRSYRYDSATFALMRRCETHRSAAVRCAVLLMLHTRVINDDIFDPAFIDIAMRHAADPDVAVRLEACRVLTTYPLGNRQDARDALFALLGDSHEHTRIWALEALAKAHDPRIPDIIELELQWIESQFTSELTAEFDSRMNVLYESVTHQPDPRYLPYLERWTRQSTNRRVREWCNDMIKVCRRAKRSK
jgi:HEAT repeat protein